MTSSDRGIPGILGWLPFFRRFGKRKLGEDVPWAEPRLPLREAVVALVTAGGVHLRRQSSFDAGIIDGDASAREIPVAAPREDLCISNDYYDRLDAQEDLNLVLPIERVVELKDAGAVGNLHPVAYSLMGHLGESSFAMLRDTTAPLIAQAMAAGGVDYALLVPAGGSCNRTVAVVARAIEAAGIPTVSLCTALEIAERTPPPRALYVQFPFGHALGDADNRNQQFAVLYLAFQLLFQARRPGTITPANLQWKRDQYAPPDWERFKKLEPLQPT